MITNFTVSNNRPTLELKNLGNCKVQLKLAELEASRVIKVEVNNDENSDLCVTQVNDVVTIKGSKYLSNSNNVFINGNSISIGGGLHFYRWKLLRIYNCFWRWQNYC